MSTFYYTTAKCGNCGYEMEIPELTSTNIFGSPDLDLRPPEMKRSTMPMWIQECSKCGYISSDISKKPNINSDYLTSWQYTNCDGISFKNNLAVRFYKRALLSILENDNLDAYNNILCAAWVCDDCNDSENAVYCRRYLDKIYIELPEKEKNDTNILVRHIDVLRRARLFDKAVELCDAVISIDEIILGIVKFQREKSLQKDYGVYRVEHTQDI